MIYYLTQFFYIFLGNNGVMPSVSDFPSISIESFDILGGILSWFRNGATNESLADYLATQLSMPLSFYISFILAIVSAIGFVVLIWKLFKYVFTIGR